MAQTPPAANPPVPAAPDTSKKPPETTAPTEQQPAVQALPPVVVTETAAPARKAKAAAHKAKTVPSAVKPSAVTPSAAAGTQPAAASAPESLLATRDDAFNQARSSLLTQVGTNSFTFSREAIEALPQGTETPVSKLLLQAPGVAQDSAASGQVHVRNEHANLQYRINGIILPDGVSGFGEVLKSDFVRSLSLVTGALPAEYGLRTSGLVDITTRAGSEELGGNISSYGGSRGTLTPSIEYGGTSGAVDYFFTGRYLMNDEGIENPTPSWDAIHDHTDQGFGFGYVSALIDNSTRLSWISGVTVQNFQIPNTPGLPPAFMVNGVPPGFDSSRLNEHQFEQNYYDVIALQKKLENVDWQLAYFARYSDLHFHPDPVGDLVFNGIASDVERSSLVNGIQGDGSYHFNAYNTLRAGFVVSAEQTRAVNSSAVLPSSPDPTMFSVSPIDIFDETSKLGWLLGIYAQNEWKITSQLTLNAGLRFDQMLEYVDANQFSPRVSLVYTPFDGTTLHAGYARYFTPPPQVAAGPTNVAQYDGTIQQSETCGGNVPGVNDTPCGPVLPERSHYFDVGINQKIFPGLEVGVDAYYKIARDLLDDGQFGAALVLDAFNYEKGINRGIEFKANYAWGNFSAYGNVAVADQKGKNIVSNQYLIGADDLAYIADHYIFTDHSQTITASAGLSYLWDGTRFSADMIYGSGLRTDGAVPNGDTVPAYTQVNLGVSHEFHWVDKKPTKLRFDIINIFDEIYQIRNGEGIGVFAPQFGPRRGYFVGLSQKF
jgi:outer membrane receptor protein involved in Fe transport